MADPSTLIAPVVEMNLRGVPRELQNYNQWCLWKYYRDQHGQVRRAILSVDPFAPSHASTSNPATWSDYHSAAAEYEEKRGTTNAYAGLTFCLTPEDPFICIDLDDMETNDAANYMLRHITSFTKTYIEQSPSKDGVHIWGTGADQITTEKVGSASKGFEFYRKSHFINMTGVPIRSGDLPLAPIGEELEKRLKFWLSPGFDPKKHLIETAQGGLEVDYPAAGSDLSFGSRLSPISYRPASPIVFTDEEILFKLNNAANSEKFLAIFQGDSSYHKGDESSAEASLATMIALYTKDPAQIARIMDESAWKNRDKWSGREDYRKRTIDFAIAHAGTYDPTPRWSTRNDQMLEFKVVDPETGEIKGEFIAHALTDTGNAKRLAGAYGDKIRWMQSSSQWYVWNEQYWEKADEIIATRFGKDLPSIISAEAKAWPDPITQKKMVKWSEASGNRMKIDAALHFLKSEPNIAVEASELDEHPHLLNCMNGTINLRTGVLHPHIRQDMITKIANCAFNPGTQGPIWSNFLQEIFAGDQDLIDFVQRCAGYSATGSVSERVFFLLHGDGRNGKSTLTEVMKYVLGDYAMNATSAVVTARKDATEQGVEFSRMPGARLVTAAETNELSRLDEAHVKNMTGGETITARRLYIGFFDFIPEFKIWMSTNHLPQVRGTDKAVWDRIVAVPFSVRIADADVDRDLKFKLQAEASAILSWLVEGSVLWHREGLGKRPDAVREAQEQYQDEMDLLGLYFRESCVLEPNVTVPVNELYTNFAMWARGDNERLIPTKREFSAKMRKRGFETIRSGHHQIHSYVGIRLGYTPAMLTHWDQRSKPGTPAA